MRYIWDRESRLETERTDFKFKDVDKAACHKEIGLEIEVKIEYHNLRGW